MRRAGNWLALAGAVGGVVAACLWWVAATTPTVYNTDSIVTDLQAVAKANKDAALVTAISALLIAAGEILRAVSRWRHHN